MLRLPPSVPSLRRMLPALTVLALVPALAPSAEGQIVREQKARVELGAEAPAVAPGSVARLRARMTIEEGWHVNSDRPTFDYLIPTVASFEVSSGWPVGDVSYPEAEMLPFAFVEEPISVFDGEVDIFAEVRIPADAPLGNVPAAVTVRYQACNDSTCLPPVSTRAEGVLVVAASAGAGAAPEGLAPIRSAAPPAPQPVPQVTADAPAAGEPDGEAAAAPAEEPQDGTQLAGLLAVALLGGLILNVMPCVLPVLSLKVFGLVKSAGQGRGEVVRAGLATTGGILVSFWVLALAAVAARGAGLAVGWGVQFQEPVFVTFLALVVLLFSLNLWGLFEIPLPARLANRLAGKAPQQGVSGHFGSGLFATLMATPCSAPFLGTAVGFALSQSALEVFTVFTVIGLGMALPYLVLAVWPAAAEHLPKPGPWMETVRGAMGFLLAGAAVWLFFVLGSQLASARLAFIQLAFLLLAMGVWLASRRSGVARPLKLLATVGALMAAAWAVGLAATGDPQKPGKAEQRLISWVPFDRAQAENLAAEGRPVFVDVTANWCVTCKVVERGVLETDEVAGAFERHGVVPMKADWTNYDPAIGDFLRSHGRAGIPFYLLYRPGGSPHLFSELPTKSSILAALAELGSTAAGGS